MEVMIRQAERWEIDQMLVLLEELFSIEKDFVFDASKSRKGLEMFMEKSDDNALFVAINNEQVVGMCSVQTVVSTAEGQKAGIIEDLVIDKQFRRNKIASLLTKTIKKWALRRGLGRLQLLADINNTEAYDFYKNTGWSKTQLICLRKYAENI